MSANFSAGLVTEAFQWMLNSPVLLDHHHHPSLVVLPLPESYQPDVHDISQHVENLLNELQHKRNHLLGIVYETLWQCIFQHLREAQLLSCNRQVQEGKRTIGEFDLIYFCSIRDAFVHREMAVKFYLGLPSARSLAEWFGPGLEDRFDLKVHRMLDQQCLLGQTPEGRRSLETLGITSVISEVLLQGCLFYPFNKPCNSPDIASDNHLFGEWLPVGELNDYLEIREICHVAPLAKQHWITSTSTPSTSFSTGDWLRQNATPLLAQHRGPVMLTGLNVNKDGYQKTCRFFLVPNDWERQARLRLRAIASDVL